MNIISSKTRIDNLLARAMQLEEKAALLSKLKIDRPGQICLRQMALGYLEEAIELENLADAARGK